MNDTPGVYAIQPIPLEWIDYFFQNSIPKWHSVALHFAPLINMPPVNKPDRLLGLKSPKLVQSFSFALHVYFAL